MRGQAGGRWIIVMPRIALIVFLIIAAQASQAGARPDKVTCTQTSNHAQRLTLDGFSLRLPVGIQKTIVSYPKLSLKVYLDTHIRS